MCSYSFFSSFGLGIIDQNSWKINPGALVNSHEDILIDPRTLEPADGLRVI